MPYIAITPPREVTDWSTACYPEVLIASSPLSLPCPVFITTAHPVRTLAILSPLTWQAMAPRQSVHGTLVAVNGQGMLLMGQPGVGKSTLALRLIERGHQLVADDAPSLLWHPTGWVGICPPTGYGMMHVRHLGLIDAKQLFSADAVRHRIPLQGTLVLQHPEKIDVNQGIAPYPETLYWGEHPVPQWTFPVEMPENLIILVEKAAQYVAATQREY